MTEISTRKLITKFGCSQSYIVQTIQRKIDIDYHKKQNIPDRSENQLSQLQPRCGRASRKFRDRNFTLGDRLILLFLIRTKMQMLILA